MPKETLQRWLRILRWKINPGISWKTQYNYKGPSNKVAGGPVSKKETCQWKQNWEWGRSMNQEMWGTSRTCKRRGNGFSPENSKRKSLVNNRISNLPISRSTKSDYLDLGPDWHIFRSYPRPRYTASLRYPMHSRLKNARSKWTHQSLRPLSHSEMLMSFTT